MGRIDWAVAAVVVLATLLAWWLVAPGAPSPELDGGSAVADAADEGPTTEAAASAPGLEGAATGTMAPSRGSGEPAPAASRASRVDPEAGYVIEGVVRELGTGLPLAAESLVAVVGRPPFTPLAELAVDARQDGSFRLEVPGPARQHVESWRFRVRELGVVGVVPHEAGRVVPATIPALRWGERPGKLDTSAGAVNHVAILAVPQFWLRGRIVREDRAALDLDLLHASAGVPIVTRDGLRGGALVPVIAADGSFEVGPFPERLEAVLGDGGLQAFRGDLHLQVHTHGLTARAVWPYGVSPAERGHVEIVLGRGIRLSGRVVDPLGRPRAGAHVSLARRGLLGGGGSTTTAADGTFRFERAPPDPVELTCRLPDEDLLGTLRLDPQANRDGLELRLEPIALPEGIEGVSLFGLRLAPVSERLQAAWGLPDGVSVVVVGVDETRRPPELAVLARGTGLLDLDEDRIRSVGELVERLERVASGGDTETLTLRVVGWTAEGPGGRTISLPLTTSVAADIRRAHAELGLAK